MPRRPLAQRSFYDPEVVQPQCLEPGTVPWLLARFRSSLFPVWRLSGWRGEGRLGRDARPAVTLLTLLFLRWSEAGVSRLGSTQRAKTDVCWRAAMGLHMQTQVPDEKTLRDVEAFLRERHPSCNVARYLLLHEHIVRLCLQAGVVLGDTAYGGATLRHRVQHELQVKIVAPPPPSTPRGEQVLRRQDIVVDFEAHTATCAAGITTDDHRRVWSNEYQGYVSAFSWPKQHCAACALRQRCCPNRQGGYHVRLHPYEQQLRQARRDWQDAQVRELYRRRSQCERLVHQLVRHGGRQAHGWGLGSAQLQAHLIAMRCNLQLLATALARGEAQRPAA